MRDYNEYFYKVDRCYNLPFFNTELTKVVFLSEFYEQKIVD
ncbi:hypothetical protein SDC9_59939 [bioreactor metagenome]|uniref:Uncharacterized protein n=1 Tax=bioreactor metagenome TaxID=1076179 RepID=A0A644XBK1_9ZZZZ